MCRLLIWSSRKWRRSVQSPTLLRIRSKATTRLIQLLSIFLMRKIFWNWMCRFWIRITQNVHKVSNWLFLHVQSHLDQWQDQQSRPFQVTINVARQKYYHSIMFDTESPEEEVESTSLTSSTFTTLASAPTVTELPSTTHMTDQTSTPSMHSKQLFVLIIFLTSNLSL